MFFVVDSQSKFVRVSLTMSNARSMCKYLPPDDIEEFCTKILNAGARLADLLVVKYPKASLVDYALFAVTKVVKCYGLKGRWVTSWASSAHNEFLTAKMVCEVSDCVALTGMTAKSCFLRFIFRLPCRQ